MNLLMWTPGPGELVVIGLIALLFFGNRLPGTMRSLGRGVTEFKRGLREPAKDESDDADGAPEKEDGA